MIKLIVFLTIVCLIFGQEVCTPKLAKECETDGTKGISILMKHTRHATKQPNKREPIKQLTSTVSSICYQRENNVGPAFAKWLRNKAGKSKAVH